jgi:hypothetical protein
MKHIKVACDHYVLGAADDCDIAILVDRCHIAGIEETVLCEIFLCLFGHTPVTNENIWTAHLQVADLAVGEYPRCDRRRVPQHRKRRTESAWFPFAMKRTNS